MNLEVQNKSRDLTRFLFEVEQMIFQRVPHIPIAVAVLTFAFFALAGPEACGQNSGSTQGEFSRQLSDVLFDFDTHESPADLAVLRADAQWLKDHPQVRFYIEGYSDPHGEIVYNLVLAQRRANSVKQVLLDMGISPDRIPFSTGWGELYQTCQDQTQDCWHRNRRVTFVYAGE